MQRALFALLAILACCSAASISDCAATFSKDISGDSRLACFSLGKLNRCVLDVLSTDFSPEARDDAQELLASQWMQFPCDVGTADEFPATIQSVQGHIKFQVGTNGDVGTTQFDRTSRRLSDVIDQIDSLNNQHASDSTSWSAAVSSLVSTTKTSLPETSTITKASSTVAPLQSTVTAYTSTISANLASFRSVLTNINSAAVAGQSALAVEENSLSSWMYTTLTQAATQRLNLNLGLADDASDTASINGEDQALLGSASTSISIALQQFIATEQSRASARAIAAGNDLASLSTGITNDLSTGLSWEVSRTVSRGTVLRTAASPRLSSTTGSTDYGACTVDGGMYWSRGINRHMICQFNNRKLFAPMLFSNRGLRTAGSSIINSIALAGFETSLLRTLGLWGTTWTKCYDAAAAGFSSTTFHTGCNNLGGTVTLGLTNNGRIFGGWTDQTWKNRNTYTYSSNSIIFRVNPSTSVFELAYYSTSSILNYAIYDHTSYCPTFGCTGGSGDIVMTNPCQNPIFTPSYFTNPFGYSNSWLAGTNSVVLTRLEVFARTN